MIVDADHPGCFTLVSGAALARVLKVLDATPAAAPDPVDDPSAGGSGLARVSLMGDHVAIWEPNGHLGSLDPVLRPLSKGGLAASVYWDVDGAVIVQWASRGRSGSVVEFPIEDFSEVPPRSRKLVRSVVGRVSDDETERQGYEVVCLLHGLDPEAVLEQDGDWFDLQVSPVELQDAWDLMESRVESDGVGIPALPRSIADKVLALDPVVAEGLARRVAHAVIKESGSAELVALGARLEAGDPSALSALLRLRREASAASTPAWEVWQDALEGEIDLDPQIAEARMIAAGQALMRTEALLYTYTGMGTQTLAGAIAHGLLSTRDPSAFIAMCESLLTA